MAKNTKTAPVKTAPQIPVKRAYSSPLRWNPDRDKAFVSAVKGNDGASLDEIAEILAGDPAFEDFASGGGEITSGKLSRRGVALREMGVSLPQFRTGKRSTPVDVEGLNALLEG